jgi:hypothetical protein
LQGNNLGGEGRRERRADSFGEEDDYSQDQSATLNANSSVNQQRTRESRINGLGPFSEFKENYVEFLTGIIQKIFHRHQNVNVLKVGLIYLARILNFYPQLCEVYLEVLLNINEEIKKTILNTDEEMGKKSNIVLSKTA